MAVRNLSRNTTYITLGWALPMLVQFVTVRAIVHGLGEDAYGILAIVLNVAGYLAFMDLGLGQAGTKYIAHYKALDDEKKLERLVGTNVLVSMIMGGVGFVAMFGLADVLATKVFTISEAWQPVAKVVFSLGGFGIALNVMSGIYAAIPTALQRFDLVNRISILAGTLSPLVMVIMVSLGYGVVESFMGRLAISGLGLGLFWLMARRLLPGVSFRPRLDRELFGQLFSFGGFTTINSFASRLGKQVDQTLVGILLGTTAVTFYTIPFMLSRAIQTLCVRLAAILLPSVSELNAVHSWESMQQLFLKATRYMTLLSLLIVVPLAVMAQQVLDVWMGVEFGRQVTSVLQIMLLTTTLHAISAVSYYVILGVGKPSAVAVTGPLLGISSIAIGLALIPHMGLVGAALAQLGAALVVVPVFVVYVCLQVHVTPRRLIVESVMRPALAACVTYVASKWLFSQVHVVLAGVLGLIVGLPMVVLALALFVTVFVGLRLSEWHWLLSNIINRKPKRARKGGIH